MNPSEGVKARTESECISAGHVTAAITHSEGTIGSWRKGTGERDSFTRVSSTNDAEWPDQNGSENPVSPFGIPGTSENREVASPIASARRPATAASSGNGDEDMLTRIRNLRVIQGDGFL